MTDSMEVIPKDNPVDEKYRVSASICFAFLLLVLGVPMWWKTTSVPRVALPYSELADLSNLDIKTFCNITLAAVSSGRAKLLKQEILLAFDKSESYKIDVNYKAISGDAIHSAFTLRDYEAVASNYQIEKGELLLLEAPNLSEVLVGSSRSIFFPSETGGLKLAQILSQWLLRDKSLTLTFNALTNPTKYSLDEENRRRFPISPTYDILLTVINPDPEKLKVSWDLPNITQDYLDPFLSHAALFANFSVKSQWLYLMPLDVRPKKVSDVNRSSRYYTLSEDVLSQLVTPLETKIASQVSLHPCINLIMYVVPCEYAPLYIDSQTGERSTSLHNAFLSPRWGGVVFLNPQPEICEAAEKNQRMEISPNPVAVMEVFISQLRQLLGMPEPEYSILGAQMTPLVDSKPKEWELDTLLRIRAIEQLTSAKLTLESLAQLLDEISNIVITDIVGNRIKTALQLVELSREKLSRGQLTEGFLLSKDAFVTAEAAFTDPSLLALLYFPEDQKYAVYIPLFLPVMIPVLLSPKIIWRYYF